MKKKFKLYLGTAVVLTAVALASCTEESAMPDGEGTMFLSTRVNSDVKVENRRSAVEDDLSASTIVWISNEEGVVRKFNSMSEVPPAGIKLMAGDYTVQAWAGKAEYASFTSRWFEGQEAVSITAGSKQSVEVVCKIANVVTSVKYADDVDTYLQDYTLTVSHKGGLLTFEGKDERKGYFIMPEGVTSLDYVLNGTFEGRPFELEGTIDNVEPAHEYVLNIFIGEKTETPMGGSFISIVVDDTMVETTDEVLITAPPSITGNGFDINSTLAGASGSIGTREVYVCAAADLTHLKIQGLPGINDFDFVTASESVISELAASGITKSVSYIEGAQVVKITFGESYLNTFPNSEQPYEIVITATDGGEKTSTATLRIRVSAAPVATGSASNLSYTSATVSGTAIMDVESAGFEYRAKGQSNWTYVDGSSSRASFTKGQPFYARLADLNVITTYEFRAVSSATDDAPDGFKGEIMEFTTLNGPQLPNAGMESWVKSGKVLLPTANAGDVFWDSGNHGSSTMNINVTGYASDKVKSGNYSAMLKSQFVGLMSIGKFAAGNIFIGKYLLTDGTDGELGFGRPFDIPSDLKIKALRVWMYYSPGAANNKGSGNYVPQGSLDQGDIYIALFDGTDDSVSGTDKDGESYQGKYGCIIRTKSSKRKLLDTSAANVVAYGDYPITSGTSGSAMVQIEVPLDYYKSSHPTHIAVVCSASRYGDYFQGGEGSILYVDDFELIYEKK